MFSPPNFLIYLKNLGFFDISHPNTNQWFFLNFGILNSLLICAFIDNPKSFPHKTLNGPEILQLYGKK